MTHLYSSFFHSTFLSCGDKCTKIFIYQSKILSVFFKNGRPYQDWLSSLRSTAKRGKEKSVFWHAQTLDNYKCIIGNFDNTLTELGDTQFDIIYVDGNHHYAPTIRYFEQLQHNAKVDTLFIFDDIHYSPAMEQAWQQIKSSDKCGVSIDLFFLGFVFFKPVLQKQHFVLRY